MTLNDSSAVIKMDYGSVTILFPGEISSKIESKLIDSDAALLKNRILIAGHHGSKTSSSAQFLDAVSPQLILISAGENSQLKLPSSEALLRMSATGATILRTDRDGEIEIAITPQSTYARTFNGKIIPLPKIGPPD